ncbi:MAG: D-2-hydroxyacid dehydrogenase [Planctomycetota bacterium]
MSRALAYLLFLITPLASCRAPVPQVGEIGSLRNARVAIARGPAPERLTYFARGLDETQRGEIALVAPGVDLVVGLSAQEALRRAGEAHGADASYATPEFLRAARKLVWVQAGSAGVDRYLAIPEIAEPESLVLTNMSGIHGPAIADHVFAMLLALTRDLPVHLAGRAAGAWKRDGSGVLTPIALQDRTLLVVGLGSIGTEIARRGKGFGMRVIATRRSDSPSPDFVEHVGKPEELLALLSRADVVAIALPLTDETKGLFGRQAFEAMKPKSYLVNIGRGKIVETDALVAALESGHLAGACLDVTDPEPLPSDHRLWKLPNVVITPHVAADAEITDARHWTLLRENLRRFDAGEPLLNVVDKRAGY